MLYRTMSEGRPATRIRSALPIATFVSVCGIGRTIFGDSKAVPHVVPRALRFPAASPGEPEAVDGSRCPRSSECCPRSIGITVRNQSEHLSAIAGIRILCKAPFQLAGIGLLNDLGVCRN